MTAQDSVPRVRAGEGRPDGSIGLCAMQVISWQDGEDVLTGLPYRADRLLARVVQRTNDNMCANRDGRLLCPKCSLAVLALADRTVGTRMVGWSCAETALTHARLAVEQAEQVAHLSNDQRVTWAVSAAWECVQHPDAATRDTALAAADAANGVARTCPAYTAGGAAAAAPAAHAAAWAAADASAAGTGLATAHMVARAASDAVVQALDAADTTTPGRCSSTDAAHRVIDRFQELTGLPELDPLATDATPALA
jgi:hypothetical protein